LTTEAEKLDAWTDDLKLGLKREQLIEVIEGKLQ